MTTPQAANNGNIRLSQQNEIHTAIVPNASSNIHGKTITSVSVQTETQPFKCTKASNNQIGSRASELPVEPQLPLPDDEMPISLKSRKQKHDLPVERKRIRISRTEQNLPQTGKTLKSKTRARDSSKVNNRESNESRVQSNYKPKVHPQLNKKRQIILPDVGPKRAINREKRVPMAKPGQNRGFDGEKRHKCKLCRYATNHTGNFAKHMRTHTGDKPYQCQMCHYASTQLSTLKEHVRIHTGEKPYKCQLCNYAATQHHSLIEHIRITTGEKPYKCRFCQFASSGSISLNRHMQRVL